MNKTLANCEKKWNGKHFVSSYYETPEFKSFSHSVLICMNKAIKQGNYPFKIVDFSKGHFEISGFMENTINGKYVYFSIPDVRYEKDFIVRG